MFLFVTKDLRIRVSGNGNDGSGLGMSSGSDSGWSLPGREASGSGCGSGSLNRTGSWRFCLRVLRWAIEASAGSGEGSICV